MRFLIIFLFSLVLSGQIRAQFCTPQTVTFPITPTSTIQYTPSYSTGVISFPFTATAGCTYTFSTCGQSSIDTYLRLYNSAYTLLGSWDDQCGLQSTFTWTCPAAGQYYVHLSRFVCTALTGPTTMSYVVSCPTPPCNNPVVNAGPDVVICAGQPTVLNGSVTAGTGSGSGGSASSITVTISGTGFLDETSWNMTNSSGSTIGSGGPYSYGSTNTINVSNPGTGPYSFSLETQGFFNDNNASYTISCNGNVVNTGSITGGQTTTISVTGCGGSSGGSTLPITYVWSPATNLSSTTVLNPTASPSVTTTYTLTATSGTCTSNDQVTVFVSPSPTVDAGPDITICNGQSTVLNGSASAVGGFGGTMTVNIFSGSNLDETTWNITNSLGQIIGSGGPYATASNNTITITNPTNPPYTFNLETQGLSNSNVAGYNVMCGTTSISGGLAILTGGQTIALSIPGCPGPIPTSFSWSPGGTLSSTTIANPTATPTTTTTYTLTASANGCTANDQVVVTVAAGPTVTVNNATICSGQTATLTATPSVSGGTYLWSPGGATTQSITVSPTATTSYSVTYSNGSCASLPASGTVTVNPAPTVSVNSSTICPGASATLTATASPSGGTYTWSPGNTTGSTLTVTPNSTTNYTVTYSINGCSSVSASGTITVANNIDWANIQAPGTTTICDGQTLTIYGQVFESGVTPGAGQGAGITVEFAYNTTNTNPNTWPNSSWTVATFNASGSNPNNDEYTGVIPILPTGTYYYAFRYTLNGCVSYGGYSASGGGFWNGTTNVNGVLVVNPNITPTFNAISAICAGGALNALPTTSTNSITGTWSPALNNQVTTTYTFTPTAGLCATTTTLTVTVNPLPSAAIAPPASTVLTCATTSITLTATGGGTYSWSNGSNVVGTNSSLTVTNPGTYTVTVTSTNGCIATATQVITQNITVPTANITAPSTSILTCTTTSINLTATGGGTYSWSNGSNVVGTNATLTVTTPGTYTVTVTGTNGCSSTASQVITQNTTAPNASIGTPSTTELNCTTTFVDLTASGGGTYSWSNGSNVLGTTAMLNINAPGTYVVTVTSSNGCTSTASQTITQNIVAPNAVILAPTSTILTCTTTSITLTGTGGGTYSWNDGTNVVGTTSTLNVTTPNTYILTVVGSNGCDATTTLTITEDITAPIPSILANTSVLNCTTTSIQLIASGGGTYSWTGGTTGSTLNVSNPGSYTVTVTGSNGCTATETQTITQNITPPTVNINATNGGVLTCATTSITLTASGGGSYLWSNGNTNSSISVTTPGTYTVTVTGSNGCSTNASQIVTQNLVAPTAAITAPSTTVLTCATTSINLVATGGTSYSWSNGTATIGNNASLAVTLPGTYTVTVTGTNGCTASSSIVITQNSTPPAATITPPTSTELTCTTTSINLTATGGISYSWSNGTTVIGTNATLSVTSPGTYTVTVMAAIGCTATASQIITQNITNPTAAIATPVTSVLTCTTTSINLTASGGGTYSWSNGTAVVGTNALLTVNSPGTYTVTVTSANGCTATASQVITQNTVLPNAQITSPTTTVLTCSTTSINLTASGGGTYSWSNGTAVVGTNALLTVNSPGTYTVTVTSANGCTATASQVITQNISLPNAQITAPSVTQLSCTTPSINLTATGGGTYSWSNGTAVVGTNATLSVTNPGTYTVTVTGTNGCSSTASQVITQNNSTPTASIAAPTTSILTCTNTSISLTASGGGTYSWSNGTAVVGTNAILSVTNPGTYTVTVTSPNGCSATASQVITQNISLPSTTVSATPSTILTCTNTSITLTATGGTSYSWSNGTTIIGSTASITVNNPGTYTVTVTGSNGCSTTASQIITQNISAPAAAINTPATTVLTCSTTSISLTATGGGTYSWSNGTTVVGTNATLSVSSPGTYTVTVTGSNGCTATTSQIITQNITPPNAVINPPTTTILTCTTTAISLNATGGGTYSWSNGTAVVGTNATLSVTAPATYTVTVTGTNGCTSTANQLITQDIVAPIAAITNNTNSTVLDCNTTQISLTGVGGTSASWSNGTSTVSNTSNLTVTAAGTYTYTGTNANGCIDTENISITFTANSNPTFTQISAICTNGTFTLPTTSTNGIQGNWSPAPNYSSTTTYTFQPNTGLCANTTTMTITVHPYPNVTVSNDTICLGGSTSLTANVNLAGGTYSWSPTISTINTITVSPNTTTSYQVVYSLLGCADTSTAEVFVKPVVIPQVSNLTICNGETAELVATASLAGGNFVWSTTEINDTIQVTPTTTTTYSVIYSLNGCPSPIINAVVTVNPVPTLGVNNGTICFGDNTTVTAIPNLPGGTFYWGNPAIVGTSSKSIAPINDTTLTVSYVLNGCSSPSATSTITVNPLPIATFSANVTQGCSPLIVTLSADDLTNGSYNWTTSNALSGTGAQTNLTFQMNGGFDVTLTTTLNGCTVTETLANYIQVDNYPIALFEPSSTLFTEANQTLNFMNNSVGAATYVWNFGDGGTSTEEGPTHTFSGNELGYNIVLTAISTLGCTDTTHYFIGYDPGLVYYIPNTFTPDGDMNNQVFTPVFSSGIDIYHYTMYIYNRWGEIIFESNDPSIGWDGSYGIDGKDVELGVYTYQIFIKIPNFDERKMIVGQVNLIR